MSTGLRRSVRTATGLPASCLDGSYGLPQGARKAPVGLHGSSCHDDVGAEMPELDGDLLADTPAGSGNDRVLPFTSMSGSPSSCSRRPSRQSGFNGEPLYPVAGGPARRPRRDHDPVDAGGFVRFHEIGVESLGPPRHHRDLEGRLPHLDPAPLQRRDGGSRLLRSGAAPKPAVSDLHHRRRASFAGAPDEQRRPRLLPLVWAQSPREESRRSGRGTPAANPRTAHPSPGSSHRGGPHGSYSPHPRPRTQQVCLRPLHPTDTRPFDRTSTVAMALARWTGWCNGTTATHVPSRTVVVTAARCDRATHGSTKRESGRKLARVPLRARRRREPARARRSTTTRSQPPRPGQPTEPPRPDTPA